MKKSTWRKRKHRRAKIKQKDKKIGKNRHDTRFFFPEFQGTSRLNKKNSVGFSINSIETKTMLFVSFFFFMSFFSHVLHFSVDGFLCFHAVFFVS